MKKYRFNIIDLDCANCAKKLENEINKIDGIKNCVVNFGTSKVTLESDLSNPLKTIQDIAEKVEPDCSIEEENTKKDELEEKNYEILRLVIGVVLAGIGFTNFFSFLFPNSNMEVLSTIIIISSYIVLLYRTIKKAIKQIKAKIIDENTLIVISCIGAYLVGKQTEGLMVILLFEIGKILEGKAIAKSRKSIKELMDIKPEYANIKKENGNLEKVSPEDVKIGDIITVMEGEKVPLDGIVVNGEADLNTSALTGESKLQQVKKDMAVLSGSINIDGFLELKVTSNYENSTVNKILELAEKATDRKAKTENFVSKMARIYTPIVLGLAAIVAIFMPIVFNDVTYAQSIYRALIFLVISCPCSIAISVPLSYFSGIGKASKSGILVKGSDYLDGLKDINKIVFDKTGTITTGSFEIYKIESFDENLSEEEILEYFAQGENFSTHPIAKSVLERFGKPIDLRSVTNLEEVSGKGIKYNFKGKEIKIGNKDFTKAKIESTQNSEIYLAINGECKGRIILKDAIKPNIKEAISNLKNNGIELQMFTGDDENIAISVAKEVGIDKVKAKMLPQDKFNELENIIRTNDVKKKVAFVGDGINDSPVLARADIGISMGGIGSSSAIEASDVVIMTDEIDKISTGIGISKKTNRIIKENLCFSIGVKLLILLLSGFGVADMWEAVFADVGTTLITIFNTLRIF